MPVYVYKQTFCKYTDNQSYIIRLSFFMQLGRGETWVLHCSLVNNDASAASVVTVWYQLMFQKSYH